MEEQISLGSDHSMSAQGNGWDLPQVGEEIHSIEVGLCGIALRKNRRSKYELCSAPDLCEEEKLTELGLCLIQNEDPPMIRRHF